jgi:hypothetical protein
VLGYVVIDGVTYPARTQGEEVGADQYVVVIGHDEARLVVRAATDPEARHAARMATERPSRQCCPYCEVPYFRWLGGLSLLDWEGGWRCLACGQVLDTNRRTVQLLAHLLGLTVVLLAVLLAWLIAAGVRWAYAAGPIDWAYIKSLVPMAIGMVMGAGRAYHGGPILNGQTSKASESIGFYTKRFRKNPEGARRGQGRVLRGGA